MSSTIRVGEIKVLRRRRNDIQMKNLREKRINHLEMLSSQLTSEVIEKEKELENAVEMSKLFIEKVESLTHSERDLQVKFDMSIEEMRELKIQNVNLNMRLERKKKELEEISVWKKNIEVEIQNLRKVNNIAKDTVCQKNEELEEMRSELYRMREVKYEGKEEEKNGSIQEIRKLQETVDVLRKRISSQALYYDEKISIELEKVKNFENEVEINRRRLTLMQKEVKDSRKRANELEDLYKEIYKKYEINKGRLSELSTIKEKYNNLKNIEICHKRLERKYLNKKRELAKLQELKEIQENLEDYKHLELKFFNAVGEKINAKISEKLREKECEEKEEEFRKKYKIMKVVSSFGFLSVMGYLVYRVQKE